MKNACISAQEAADFVTIEINNTFKQLGYYNYLLTNTDDANFNDHLDNIWLSSTGCLNWSTVCKRYKVH